MWHYEWIGTKINKLAIGELLFFFINFWVKEDIGMILYCNN